MSAEPNGTSRHVPDRPNLRHLKDLKAGAARQRPATGSESPHGLCHGKF
jgi:hypothetical protein